MFFQKLLNSFGLSISVTFSHLKYRTFEQLQRSPNFRPSFAKTNFWLSACFFKPKYVSPLLLLATFWFLSQSLGFIFSPFVRFLFWSSIRAMMVCTTSWLETLSKLILLFTGMVVSTTGWSSKLPKIILFIGMVVSTTRWWPTLSELILLFLWTMASINTVWFSALPELSLFFPTEGRTWFMIL